MQQVKLVVNPVAGKKRAWQRKWAALEAILRQSRVAYQAVSSEAPGHALKLAREAVAQGYPLVVAVGGDGTINQVASALVHTDTVLGIMPFGSGNALARSLGIPVRADRATRVVLGGQDRIIDAGQMAGHYFFSTAGIGLAARVAEAFNRRLAGYPRGILPYIYLTLKTYRGYQPQRVRLRLANRELVVEPLLLTLANTDQFGAGLIIAPHAQADDGLLEVCVLEPMGLGRLLYHIPKLWQGKADQMPGMKRFQASEVTIIRPGPGVCQIDGDVFEAAAEVQVKLWPRALKVRVP